MLEVEVIRVKMPKYYIPVNSLTMNGVEHERMTVRNSEGNIVAVISTTGESFLEDGYEVVFDAKK